LGLRLRLLLSFRLRLLLGLRLRRQERGGEEGDKCDQANQS
jgi:hypothetical protein